MKVSFDKYSLKINRERVFLRSGSFHYFRLPSQKLWQDRLGKIKEAGLNCVDFYFPWNYHSPTQNTYDFSGIRDVNYLMNLAEKLGLYVIARPGPYICAEIDAGGFPDWLLAKKNVILRCREKGKFEYSPEYIKYVSQWYHQIVPKIAKHKNVILFQIENEYASYILLPPSLRKLFKKFSTFLASLSPILPMKTKHSQTYLKELYRLARKEGIKVPIFHNDLPSPWAICLDTAGRLGVVDIVATDDYSFFGQNWKTKIGSFIGFRSLDLVEKWLRPLNPKAPLFITELQGGWFDGWGGKGYEILRKIMGPEHIDIVSRSAIAQGVTLLNYYMFCGGTSWGYLAAPCVYTSYDFGAPIMESGLTGERYEVVKVITKFIKENEKELCQTEKDLTIRATNKEVFYGARVNPKTKTRFIFLRNLTRKEQKTKLNIWDKQIVVRPLAMPILVLKKENDRPIIYESYQSKKSKARPEPKRQILNHWQFAHISFQISPNFDDSSWQKILPKQKLDMDSLGFHYGYVWYRGKFKGKARKILIDVRHCASLWLNGKLLASPDNIQNLQDGSDFAETKEIAILKGIDYKKENVLVILAESLGHKKNFEDDAKQPRGIVSCQIPGKRISWKVKGGLIEGESGLTPNVDFGKINKNFNWKKVKLPHRWQKEGTTLYKTTFVPNLPNNNKKPIGLVIAQALDKANIYLNGFLLGKYWEAKGPQNKFYLPKGILKNNNKNKLHLVVWKRKKQGRLGKVYLETYTM